MELSVIIPNHCDLKITDCINSIDEDVEIVIVLNKPTRSLKELISRQQFDENVKIVEIPQANLAKALNAGIRAATNDHVLLMDSDCIFYPGTIAKLNQGLRYAPLSKGKVEFKSNSWFSSIVAKSRDYHTSSFVNAYSPPLAFKKSIEKNIGYFFHDELNWSEDYDFDLRVRKAKLKIAYIASARVSHPPLKMSSDLKSAFRYGVGYQIGAYYKLFPRHKLLSISNLMHWVKTVRRAYAKYGFNVAAYMSIWNRSYFLGVFMQRYFNIYNKNYTAKGVL